MGNIFTFKIWIAFYLRFIFNCLEYDKWTPWAGLFFFSWFNIFNQLRNAPNETRLTQVSLARQFYPRPSAEYLLLAMNSSINFIVGRNPLERLVSGYRDKIINAFTRSEHDALRRVIQFWTTLKLKTVQFASHAIESSSHINILFDFFMWSPLVRRHLLTTFYGKYFLSEFYEKSKIDSYIFLIE